MIYDFKFMIYDFKFQISNFKLNRQSSIINYQLSIEMTHPLPPLTRGEWIQSPIVIHKS